MQVLQLKRDFVARKVSEAAAQFAADIKARNAKCSVRWVDRNNVTVVCADHGEVQRSVFASNVRRRKVLCPECGI